MKNIDTVVYVSCPFIFAVAFICATLFGTKSPTQEATILKVGFTFTLMSLYCICGLLAKISSKMHTSK